MISTQVLRKKRKENGLTQEQLAKILGISRSLIVQYETGRTFIPNERIPDISKVLHISAEELAKEVKQDRIDYKINQLKTQSSLNQLSPNTSNNKGNTECFNAKYLLQVPVFAEIPAGYPFEITPKMKHDAIATRTIDIRGFSNPSKVYGLVVRGDSMLGRDIKDGDVIIIDPNANIINGDVVVASIDNNVTVKTYFRFDGMLQLQSANPEYPAIILRGNELDNVRILGCVIETIRRIKK